MKHFITLFCLIASTYSYSQIGVGTTVPDPSSLLDLSSSAKGMLVPRMTTMQKNAIPSPATGLLIYQTDSTSGFYFYNGGWKILNPSLTGYANSSLSNLGDSTFINSSLTPSTAGLQNFGSISLPWKNAYFNGEIFLKSNRFITGDGTNNSFVGQSAGNTTVTGSGNTGIGAGSLSAITTGVFNSSTGARSLNLNSTGSNNTANGYQALSKNTVASSGTAIGAFALANNTGGQNTAIGTSVLTSNTSGTYNTACGYQSMYSNTTGAYNTAGGTFSLFSNASGNDNVAFGQYALYYTANTYDNTAIGYSAGDYTYNPTQATFLGSQTRAAVTDLSNITAVGYGATVSASNSVRVGNSTVTSIGGQVGWTSFSDGRFKRNIKEDVPGLAFINNLHPVTYNLDVDAIDKAFNTNMIKARNGSAERTSEKVASPAEIKARQEKAQVKYTGFIAQEVEQTAKKLNYDFSGVDKPKNNSDFYGIRYSDFVVPLVKSVQELSEKNNRLEAENKEIKARLEKLEAALALLKK